MREYYDILGLTEDATDEEIDKAYKKLKDKYLEDRFLEGELGNNAAKNLTKLETAYAEIITDRRNSNDKNGENGGFTDIETLIRQGKINEAQAVLDDFSERDAEWHYLQAVIFYKKNWFNESKKQLEIALSLDPYNTKYTDTLAKLKRKTDFNEQRFSGATPNNSAERPEERQMGGNGFGECCQFCATWCCIDMMCSICCH